MEKDSVENKAHHSSHHKHSKGLKHKIKKWLKNNWKWIFIIVILLFFLIGNMIDSKRKDVNYQQIIENTTEINNNYDAILTVVDGEGEATFTKKWGKLIENGYPICSNLVTNYIGKKGYMDWDTIESLNNVGIEFIFHTSAHTNYSNMSEDEIIKDIEYGKSEMEKHGLNNDLILWNGWTKLDICEFGSSYFKGGFAIEGTETSKENGMHNKMTVPYYYDASNYSLEDLKKMIYIAKTNNDWIVLFTRNNEMNDEQIENYRQAFEYANEINVGIVTASEGYDLYYGNKLGSH